MFKFHISKDDYMYRGCMLNIVQDLGDKYGILFLDKIEIKAVPKGDSLLDPHPLQLMDDEAQSLLQALWNAGYRPNNGESTIAHVESLKYHLEDMRKLVFK